MNSGIINLAPLYKYLDENSYNQEILSGQTEIAKGYSEEAKKLCNSIETKQGVYLWGYYDKNKFWTNQYIGQASRNGSESEGTLKARILKELRTERLFLWGEKSKFDDVRDFAIKHYAKNQPRVEKHFRRACAKKSSTYILWCAMDQVFERKILNQIEADLIEALNPVGNEKRPTPSGLHDIAVTAKIIAVFRDLIHSERNK